MSHGSNLGSPIYEGLSARIRLRANEKLYVNLRRASSSDVVSLHFLKLLIL